MGLKNVKVVFCGPRGFGITPLIKQIFYEEAPFANSPIPKGKNPNVKRLNPYHHVYQHKKSDDDVITLNIWEHGTNFHMENKFPLQFTTTTLYVYVWPYGSGDINDEIKIFINNYMGLNDLSSKVLFVVTHNNGSNGDCKELKRILEKNTAFKPILDNVFYVGREADNQGILLDCYNNTDELKNLILKFAEEKETGIIRFAEQNPYLIDIVNAVQNLISSGSYYIKKDEFFRICEENCITSEADKLKSLKFLERSGLVHCFSPKELEGVSDIVVLDPTRLVADFDHFAAPFLVNDHKLKVEDIEEDVFKKILFGKSFSLRYRYFKNLNLNDDQQKQWLGVLTSEQYGDTRPKRIKVEHYQIYYKREPGDLFERLIEKLLSLGSKPTDISNRYMDIPQIAFICDKYQKKDYYISRGEAGFFCGSAASRIGFSGKKIYIEIYAENTEYSLFKDLTGILFSLEKKLRDELNLEMPDIYVYCTNAYSWQDLCKYIININLDSFKCSWKYNEENLFCDRCCKCLDKNLGIDKLCRGLKNYEA